MARSKKSVLVPIREPSGRLLRSVETAIDARPPAEVRRLRDAASSGMAAPEWGTELGRLFLAGKIGPKLFETGKRWARLSSAYHQATGAPLEAPATAAFFKTPSNREADPDSDEGRKQAKRDRNIVSAAEEALAILVSAGHRKERAVRLVCERNETPSGENGLSDLIIGLGWLAQHWGIISLVDTRKSEVRNKKLRGKLFPQAHGTGHPSAPMCGRGKRPNCLAV